MGIFSIAPIVLFSKLSTYPPYPPFLLSLFFFCKYYKENKEEQSNENSPHFAFKGYIFKL